MSAIAPYAYGVGRSSGAGDPTASWRFDQRASLVDRVRGVPLEYTRADTGQVFRIVKKSRTRRVKNYSRNNQNGYFGVGYNPAAMTWTDSAPGTTTLALNGQNVTVGWRDIRVQGMPTGGVLQFHIYLEPANLDYGFRRGDTVTLALFACRVGGTMQNVSDVYVGNFHRRADGVTTAGYKFVGWNSSNLRADISAADRIVNTYTLIDSTAEKSLFYVQLNFANTVDPVDITIRLGGTLICRGVDPGVHINTYGLTTGFSAGVGAQAEVQFEGPAAEYVPSNQPLFENKADGAALGLLAISSANNLIANSSQANSFYAPGNFAGIAHAEEMAPLFEVGQMTKHLRDSGGDGNVGTVAFSCTAGVVYQTFRWVYVPAGQVVTSVRLSLEAAGAGAESTGYRVDYDLTKAGTWQRLSCAYNTGTAVSISQVLRIESGSGVIAYSQNPMAHSGGAPGWTPDVVTFGSSNGHGTMLTKLSDLSKIDFNAAEGFVAARFEFVHDHTANLFVRICEFSDGTSNNRIVFFHHGTDNYIRGEVIVGGATVAAVQSANGTYTKGQIAVGFGWKDGNTYLIFNGGAVLTLAAYALPAVNKLNILSQSNDAVASHPARLLALDYYRTQPSANDALTLVTALGQGG